MNNSKAIRRLAATLQDENLRNLTLQFADEAESGETSDYKKAMIVSEINKREHYTLDGFDTINQYCKAILGLDRNMTGKYLFLSNFIDGDPKYFELDYRFEGFGFTAINEFKPLVKDIENIDQIRRTILDFCYSREIDNETSCRRIRTAVKNYLNPSGDETDCTEGENETETENANEKNNIEEIPADQIAYIEALKALQAGIKDADLFAELVKLNKAVMALVPGIQEALKINAINAKN